MATHWDTSKDMVVLLAIIHISKIDVNLDVAERIVAGWPAAMGEVPANADGILRRVGEIWQMSISNVAPSTPAVLSAPPTVKKESNGSCSRKAIVIIDDDTPTPASRPFPLPRTSRAQPAAILATPRNTNRAIISDDEDELETPDTPAPVRSLPRAFRVPPGASLVTPGSQKSIGTLASTTKSKKSNVAIYFGQSNGKNDSPASKQVRRTAEKHDAALPTPKTFETASNAIKASKSRKKPKTLRNPTARNDSKADEGDIETPLTIATTRKRRRGLDYTNSPSDYCFDNADDDDYEFEDAKGDERLEAIFESSCPVVTPSKPQKKR